MVHPRGSEQTPWGSSGISKKPVTNPFVSQAHDAKSPLPHEIGDLFGSCRGLEGSQRLGDLRRREPPGEDAEKGIDLMKGRICWQLSIGHEGVMSLVHRIPK